MSATEPHPPQTPGVVPARPDGDGASAPHQPQRDAQGVSSTAPTPSASSPAPSSPAPPPERPPLPADELLALRVEGLPDQLVSLPSGSRGRHAVLLALHGWGDMPEWECPIWREIVAARVFVLCPRGVAAQGGGFTWQSAAHLERAVTAGLRALADTWPEHVDDERPLLTGFSLGAIYGRALFARDPGRWAGAVLVEGGFEAPPLPALPRGATRPEDGAPVVGAPPAALPRVLFVCGQWECEERSRALARRHATRAAIEVVALRVGHTYGGPVSRAIEGAWAHIAGADGRFARE